MLRLALGFITAMTSLTLMDRVVLAQEIHLRSTARVVGSLVTLGDVAEISGGSLADRQALQQLVLKPYSPDQPLLAAQEIREELAAAGWNLLFWEVNGAGRVQLHTSDSPLAQQHQQRRLAAVQGPTSASSGTRSFSPMPTANFAATHPSSQRTGVVQAQWQDEAIEQGVALDPSVAGDLRRQPVTSTVWTFRQDMSRGQVVTEEDVEQLSLRRAAPQNVVFDRAEIIGQALRTAVPAGRPILSAHLEAIKHVQRGKEVTLLSRVGPIEVSTTARSLADGTVGQTITIESLDRKRHYQGSVIAFNTVQVIGGQQARDGAIVAQVTPTEPSRTNTPTRTNTPNRIGQANRLPRNTLR
jgi:flagella basal body P-ring formation protein FlgA